MTECNGRGGSPGLELSPVPLERHLWPGELPFTAWGGDYGELDLRVFDQDTWWVDIAQRPHWLVEMPPDYITNVIALLAGNFEYFYCHDVGAHGRGGAGASRPPARPRRGSPAWVLQRGDDGVLCRVVVVPEGPPASAAVPAAPPLLGRLPTDVVAHALGARPDRPSTEATATPSGHSSHLHNPAETPWTA